jgi:hypothetical protein
MRKEKALATMREIQLAELQGSMVPIATVEALWAGAVTKLRDAMLGAEPVRVPLSRPAPRRNDHSRRSGKSLEAVKGQRMLHFGLPLGFILFGSNPDGRHFHYRCEQHDKEVMLEGL